MLLLFSCFCFNYLEVLLVLALCIYHTTFALVSSLSALEGGIFGHFLFIVIIDGGAGLELVAGIDMHCEAGPC